MLVQFLHDRLLIFCWVGDFWKARSYMFSKFSPAVLMSEFLWYINQNFYFCVLAFCVFRNCLLRPPLIGCQCSDKDKCFYVVQSPFSFSILNLHQHINTSLNFADSVRPLPFYRFFHLIRKFSLFTYFREFIFLLFLPCPFPILSSLLFFFQ